MKKNGTYKTYYLDGQLESVNEQLIKELNSLAYFCQGATEEMIYEEIVERIRYIKSQQ